VTGPAAVFRRLKLDSRIVLHKKESTIRNGKENTNKPQ
jgi:hypothetical protein